ncbi:GGDEF domain-containing protein [uncultured Shewanella sp.]|uniref:GGDEF domain-containing protein n=1 Tax=uncultured Shewanella sp. TaxID=173975 RepID=UPI00260B1818|nr:GGDEF domain-containing protein [uncultured Shewanella sp.]
MTFSNKRIEKYYTLYQELLSFSGVSWWLIDLEDNSNVFYCNSNMRDMFSLDSNTLQHSVSKTCPIAGDFNKNIAVKDAHKAKRIFEDYCDLRLGRIDEYHNRFPYYDASQGEILYFTSKARAILRDDCGNAQLLFGIIERERTSAKLFKLSKLDALTGLNNRREFDSQLDFIINLARREQQPISLILCDIDNFKVYNDMLGHYQGDQCLINVSQTIANVCARSTDVVCRYGGEEFAVICYGSHEDVASLAENIRANIESLELAHPEASDRVVTMSLGFTSCIPSNNTTARELIEKADAALYQAKQMGKNRCIEFNSSTGYMVNSC